MRRYLFPYFAAASLQLLIGLHSLAQSPKEPWLWTKEERVRALLDPDQRSARSRASDAKEARMTAKHGVPGPPAATRSTSSAADVIDGTENPELFFPTELFHDLVLNSFITLPQVYPRVVLQRSSDLFHRGDEWDFFRSVTTEFAHLLQRERELRKLRVRAPASERPRIDREIGHVREAQCPAMATALRALRERFGPERFDRMLYEVVPPGHSISFGRDIAQNSKGGLQMHVKEQVRNEEECQ